MSRVAVTGASGFIGRHAVAALRRRGADVVALSRSPRPGDMDRDVAWLQADLLSPGFDGSPLVTRHGCDRLLHLAWIAEPGAYRTSSDNERWRAASSDLARRFIGAGGARIVGCGTCAEYLPPPDGPCYPADTPTAGQDPYASAKIAFHRRLVAEGQRGGASVAWGRVFNVYGPGEDPRRLIPGLAQTMLRGEAATCRHGQLVRDFLDVRDCGEALAALTLAEATGPFNICSGEPVRLGDVALRLAAAVGHPERLTVGTLPPPPGEPPALYGDAARTWVELGFVPRHSLDAGLAETVARWRALIGTGTSAEIVGEAPPPAPAPESGPPLPDRPGPERTP